MRREVQAEFPSEAGAVFELLTFVALNAAGNAVPFTGAAGQTNTGCFAHKRTDNAAGLAGERSVAVTAGTEEFDVKDGDTPKRGQQAFVDTSTSATTTIPGADADAKSVGIFLQPSQQNAKRWLIDTRPIYFSRRLTVA